jgi:hypothetical protein
VGGIQQLKVNSEISVDDALLLLGRFGGLGSESGIRSVELGGTGVGAYEPSLLPEYLESEVEVEFEEHGVVSGGDQAGAGFVSKSPSSKKISLPKLDSLRITATVSLGALLAAVDLPRLCKLELDLGDAGDSGAAEDTLYALLGTLLMPSKSIGVQDDSDGLLYLDVRHGGTFEVGERVRGSVLQRSPFAYVSFNGE